MAEPRPSSRGDRDRDVRLLGHELGVPRRLQSVEHETVGDVSAPLPRATRGWLLGLAAALVFWIALGLVVLVLG